jgi:GTPase KRas protein
MNRTSSMVKDGMRMIVLGVGTVGKSSITLRFTMNTFTGDFIPTVQDTFRKNTMVDGEIAQLGNFITRK